MKARLIVVLLSAGLGLQANAAEPVASAEPVSATATGANSKSQFRTDFADQVLVDVSTRAEEDLAARLEREVGGEVTVRVRRRPEPLLVSTH